MIIGKLVNILGNFELKVEFYKDGILFWFCNGDGLFYDLDFVILEVFYSLFSDMGCYELYLMNELGIDVSLVNVIVKEDLCESFVVWEFFVKR